MTGERLNVIDQYTCICFLWRCQNNTPRVVLSFSDIFQNSRAVAKGQTTYKEYYGHSGGDLRPPECMSYDTT